MGLFQGGREEVEMTAMWCPVCARRLTRDEFQPAGGDMPDRWMCGDCDCIVNEYDDEYEQPHWIAAAENQVPACDG
jgi:hypothetical protein